MIVYCIKYENNLLLSNRLTDLAGFGIRPELKDCDIKLFKIKRKKYIREINLTGISFFTDRREDEIEKIINYWSGLE